MFLRNKTNINGLVILFVLLVLFVGIFTPTGSQAREYLSSGSGMAEGDPGDGDDSLGGGGGTSNPGGIPSESATPKYQPIILVNNFIVFSNFNGIPHFQIFGDFSAYWNSDFAPMPFVCFGGKK